MNREIDWQAEAKTAANHVYQDMFSAHRGAMPWRDLGVSVVFGNDGYGADVRAQREVAEVRKQLAEAGIAELGFAACDADGYSWALLALTADCQALEAMAWRGWDVACGDTDEPLRGTVRVAQRSIADRTLSEFGDKGPKSSLN